MANSHLKSKNQLLTELFMVSMHNDQRKIPLEPTLPSKEIRILRARLMLEECLETIRDGLGVEMLLGPNDCTRGLFLDCVEFCSERPGNLVELADGLADCDVVNNGTASACGIAMQPILSLVYNNNNLEKFAPGHKFSPEGKLLKPPGHKPPDIAGLLCQQGWDGEVRT